MLSLLPQATLGTMYPATGILGGFQSVSACDGKQQRPDSRPIGAKRGVTLTRSPLYTYTRNVLIF